MASFLLRRNTVVKAYPDEYRIILWLDDGYELEVGHISKQSDVGNQSYWAWAGPTGNGREPSKEDAMAAFKTAWHGAEHDLAAMRERQEEIEWKYALWGAGYRDQMGKGPLRCRCGALFDANQHAEVRAHIGHITAGTNQRPQS